MKSESKGKKNSHTLRLLKKVNDINDLENEVKYISVPGPYKTL